MSKLTSGLADTLRMFQRTEFWPDGALWLNGPRKRHCRNLVARGLLTRQEYPKSSGYSITPAGRSALTEGGKTDV